MYDINQLFSFLRDLKYNNHTEWMHSNRASYLKAKETVIGITTELLLGLSEFVPGASGIEARRLIYRINRDIRFSPNKLPYITHMGFFLPSRGPKRQGGGFLLYLQPEDEDGDYFQSSALGAGLHCPGARLSRMVREEIFLRGSELRTIMDSESFKKAGWKLYDKEQLKIIPKALRGSDYDDLIRLRNWSLFINLSEDEVKAPDFVERCLAAYRSATAWNGFFDRIVDQYEAETE